MPFLLTPSTGTKHGLPDAQGSWAALKVGAGRKQSQARELLCSTGRAKGQACSSAASRGAGQHRSLGWGWGRAGGTSHQAPGSSSALGTRQPRPFLHVSL